MIATHAYVGICRVCDGTMMLAEDDIEHAADVSFVVAACISGGFLVERMMIQDADRRVARWCRCKKVEVRP